ncbi:MAG: hypothetical protein EOM72_00210 [Opitutae bacterium]|nr:hypothetical protein [Opitutae bacterium]
MPTGFRRWACAIHMALIAVLSLLPAWRFPPSLAQIPGADKWAHVAMYGVLGALFRWAAELEEARSPRWLLPAAAIGYGLLMEILQLTLRGGVRTFSWADAVANGVGAVGFWWGMGRFLQNREIPPR